MKIFRPPWIYVILAFVLLISAWSTLIVIASKNRADSIELNLPGH